MLLIDQISLSGYLYFLRYWGNMCKYVVCTPGCDIMNFEVDLTFLIKQFFLHDREGATKT